jgi:uncharacterized protein (DUF433 family)
MSQTLTNLIEIRPSRVVGNRAYIAGTRVSVEDIFVRHEMGGQTPDGIVQSLPHLSLAQVHAALSYAFGHLEEIRLQIKEGDSFLAELQAIHGPGPLARKLSELHGTSDEVPSG